MLHRVAADLDPAAGPGVVLGGVAVRGHQRGVAVVRRVGPPGAVAGGDVDAGDADAALHRFDEIRLHEQQIVVLVRDDDEIVCGLEGHAVAELVVAARAARDQHARGDGEAMHARTVAHHPSALASILGSSIKPS